MRPDLRKLLASPTPPPMWPKPPTRLRDAASAVAVGRWLGPAFGLCMLTGIFSHFEQHPTGWFPLPTGPTWIFQLTQGLHVGTGLAAIPLLLAKLWTVYPRLFSGPPARTVVEALERVSIAVLVSAAVFELVTGLFNILQWYPWPFGFIQAHWWVAWLAIGALLLHLAVKAPLIAAHWRQSLRRRAAEPVPEVDSGPKGGAGISRRALLVGTGAAAAVVTAVTAGQSVPLLRPIAVLAPRRPSVGAAGVPINRTAASAGVLNSAVDPAWRLEIAGQRPLSLSLADLAARRQRTHSLPIACVEGWSVTADWTGVRLRDLLDEAGIAPGSHLRMISLQQGGGNHTALLPANFARDPLTLVALRLDGEPLSLDHGRPCRLVAPGRPGVAQTKWLARIEVTEL